MLFDGGSGVSCDWVYRSTALVATKFESDRQQQHGDTPAGFVSFISIIQVNDEVLNRGSYFWDHLPTKYVVTITITVTAEQNDTHTHTHTYGEQYLHAYILLNPPSQLQPPGAGQGWAGTRTRARTGTWPGVRVHVGPTNGSPSTAGGRKKALCACGLSICAGPLTHWAWGWFLPPFPLLLLLLHPPASRRHRHVVLIVYLHTCIPSESQQKPSSSPVEQKHLGYRSSKPVAVKHNHHHHYYYYYYY